jgi:hypothetical protein
VLVSAYVPTLKEIFTNPTFLAADKKEMEQAKKQVQEKATNIKMLMDWRKGMENDGWSWSKPHNNYYKTNEQGERIWNEVGFLVDRWVGDPLQAKR